MSPLSRPSEMPSIAAPDSDAVRRTVRECAEDLMSVRDRRVVLSAIVRRARTLIGVDMAYLSINDLAAGETRIEYSEGVRTEAYRTIRMPLGTGVLGAVASGNRPVQTSSYLTDGQMNHLRHIDRYVEAEGVHAILGVPIRAGGRVVAALMVAHREAVRFTDETVAALEDVGAQAGVAFEQLRLAAEAGALREQARSDGADSKRRSEALESLLSLDDRLVGAMQGDLGIDGIVDVLTQALGEPVGIHDPSGVLLGGVELVPTYRWATRAWRSLVSVSYEAQRPVVGPPDPDGRLLVMAVAAGAHLATLVTRDAHARQSLLARAAVFVAMRLLFDRMLAEAATREQTQLIEALVATSGRKDAALHGRLGAHGFDASAPAGVVVCALKAADRATDAIAVARTVAPGGSLLVSQHAQHLCVLHQHSAGTPDPQFANRLLVALREAGVEAHVGAAVADDAADLGRAHGEAAAASAALRALGRTDTAADAVGLGIAGMMAGARDGAWVGQLIDDVLGPVIEYDARRGSQLVLTAWHVLECGGRYQRVADALRVHRNTVRQRAERIDALLGVGWRAQPRSADVQFALRLWRLRQGSSSV